MPRTTNTLVLIVAVQLWITSQSEYEDERYCSASPSKKAQQPSQASHASSEIPCQQVCFKPYMRTCQICYRRCGQALTLLSCQTQICANYGSYYDAKASKLAHFCQPHQQKYNYPDPPHCMAVCCAGDSHFIWPNVEKCQNYWSDGAVVAIILTTVFMFVFVVIFVIAAVDSIRQINKKKKQMMDRARAMRNR